MEMSKYTRIHKLHTGMYTRFMSSFPNILSDTGKYSP